MDWRENKPGDGNIDSIEALEQRARMYLATAKEQQFAEYLQKMLVRIRKQKNQVKLLNDELDRSYQMYLNRTQADKKTVQAETVVQQEKLAIQPTPQPTPEPVTYVAYQPQPPVAKKKTNNEFFVGTVLLSIVGGAFILTALVMLGMYFMNGFLKGMCLYAGSVVLLLVSELVLYRKWPKLGKTFTAIAIGGLYLSTVLNYLTFGNFNMWVALGIALAITVMVIVLSWKRDSLLYKTLGLITCYLCFWVIQGENTLQEITVLALITFLINVMCMVMPMQHNKTVFRIIHICVNSIYAFGVCMRISKFDDMVNAQLVLALSASLIMQILFVLQMRYQDREAANGKNVGKYGIVAAYFVAGLFCYYALPSGAVIEGSVLYYGSFATLLILVMAAMIFLRKSQGLWYPYFMISLITFDYFCIRGEKWETVIAMAVLVVVAKLLSLLKIQKLQVSEAIITTMCCIIYLCHAAESLEAYSFVLLAAILFSIPFIRYWRTYYEIVLTFTLAFFAAVRLPSVLQLPAFVGIMFVGIFIFNNVKRWQGKNIIVFNGLALAGQIVCFLLLLNPVYQNAYIVYLCMLIFGLATIVLTFQEKYHMNFKQKNLILAVFLTYMAFVLQTSQPIINSIFMMLIALICVGLGFAVKEKWVRIYGLVLSLIICGKITLYDSFDTAALQKTILFFTVGIIALAISGIYIILERRMNIQQTAIGEEQ